MIVDKTSDLRYHVKCTTKVYLINKRFVNVAKFA